MLTISDQRVRSLEPAQLKVSSDGVGEDSAMMKSCYDYYLNYYSEKYSVQQAQPTQEPKKQAEVASVAAGSASGESNSTDKESTSLFSSGLVAYSESDSD